MSLWITIRSRQTIIYTSMWPHSTKSRLNCALFTKVDLFVRRFSQLWNRLQKRVVHKLHIQKRKAILQTQSKTYQWSVKQLNSKALLLRFFKNTFLYFARRIKCVDIHCEGALDCPLVRFHYALLVLIPCVSLDYCACGCTIGVHLLFRYSSTTFARFMSSAKHWKHGTSFTK